MEKGGFFRRLLQQTNASLPENLRHDILVRRRTRLFREAGVVFIHIPKAAGSSINGALYGQFMGHYTARRFLQAAPTDVKALPRFAVTRNPWSRALSAYRFARKGMGSGDGVVAGVRNAAQYDIPEFGSFERFLIEWLDERDIYQLDGIFRPQLGYVADQAGTIIVDHIGKVEELGKTSEWLEQKLERQVEFSHSNQSGEPLDFRKFYSAETADIIARKYRMDIEQFGYEY